MISRQRGVALAMVVWFIAGMSLLVAGIVAQARVDTRTTQVHLAKAKAVAAGDGAVSLAMMERIRGFSPSSSGPMVSETRHRLGEIEVEVRIIPSSGFVDVNHAPAEVLQTLFHLAGGLERGQAKFVADNVLKWRNSVSGANARGGVRSRGRQFYSLEDMLRVDGVTRTLLDSIRDYCVAGAWTDGRMSWSAAPASMMQMLQAMNPAQSGSVSKRRDVMSQTSEVRGNGNASVSGVYRADALVIYGGRTWLRRRWLKMESGSDSNLPWRIVRTEAPRVVRI